MCGWIVSIVVHGGAGEDSNLHIEPLFAGAAVDFGISALRSDLPAIEIPLALNQPKMPGIQACFGMDPISSGIKSPGVCT